MVVIGLLSVERNSFVCLMKTYKHLQLKLYHRSYSHNDLFLSSLIQYDLRCKTFTIIYIYICGSLEMSCIFGFHLSAKDKCPFFLLILFSSLSGCFDCAAIASVKCLIILMIWWSNVKAAMTGEYHHFYFLISCFCEYLISTLKFRVCTLQCLCKN